MAAIVLLVASAGCGKKEVTLSGPVVKNVGCTTSQVERTGKAPEVPKAPKAVKKVATTDEVKGKGATASASSTDCYVSLDLIGATATDGNVFTSTWKSGHPLTVRLGQGQLIAGLEKGVTGMKVGGRRAITVPAKDAYGKTGNPAQGVGANQDLEFVVELVAVTEEPKYCSTATVKPGDNGKPVPGKPTKVDLPVAAPTTLKNTDLKVGTGKAAKKGNYVTVDYLGISCPTGVEFDSSWGKQPFPLTVGEKTIDGFGLGIVGMKKGGLRRVEIPWEKAYGVAGQPPTIGPREPLVFVIAVRTIADKPPSSTTTPSVPATAPVPSTTAAPAGSTDATTTTR
ncbi:MAG: FKBP-type peptidyl-prolyl cis-trans isomerase [Acidimicrobiales bacterium]